MLLGRAGSQPPDTSRASTARETTGSMHWPQLSGLAGRQRAARLTGVGGGGVILVFLGGALPLLRAVARLPPLVLRVRSLLSSSSRSKGEWGTSSKHNGRGGCVGRQEGCWHRHTAAAHAHLLAGAPHPAHLLHRQVFGAHQNRDALPVSLVHTDGACRGRSRRAGVVPPARERLGILEGLARPHTYEAAEGPRRFPTARAP